MRRIKFTYAEGPEIHSVGHLLSEIKRFAGQGDYRLYFRGHGAPVHALQPSIGRKHYYLGVRCSSMSVPS